ncbi:AraC family transcriptional regulator [Nocardia amamiensis]|uniref:AraC family transcriptional regulator n=1 Tax=Nocardia amamiensis TaxID=404578 RepID=UPI0008324EC5|nr:AraC family transcriptional regulator [Nocardia amamiensis]
MTTDQVILPKFVLDSLGLAESPRHQLARAAALPDWVWSSSDLMVPSDSYVRLWELVEHELGDPVVALHSAATYVPGRLGLFDYLLTTAPTLGEGLALIRPHLGIITTNLAFALVGGSENEVGLDIRMLRGQGRGRELAMQFALASNVIRARYVTGRQVNAVRVCFHQQAPRRHGHLVELFGTDRIDFGAPTDQITFRKSDLELPMRTADPVLAEILLRYAATLPPPHHREATWSGRVHHVLTAMLGDGPVTVDRAARRLATSKRSMQRRLAEEGTTWSQELDRARRARLEVLSQMNPGDSMSLARRLGYSDTGAFYRARRRWSTQPPPATW